MSDTQPTSDYLLPRLKRYAEQNVREPWIPVKAVELLALVECAEALINLYEDQMDYIRLNHLSGAENNHNMVASRDAILKLEAL